MAAKKRTVYERAEYTKERAKILKDNAQDVTKAHLAALMGMCPNTLLKLMRRDKACQRDYDRARAKLVKKIHSKFVQSCLAGHEANMRFFLMHNHSDYKPAAMVSVEQKVDISSTETLYRPIIHRYDGSDDPVDPETPDPEAVELTGDEIEEVWDVDEPKTLKELQMEAAEREMELASSKTQDDAAIFL